MPTAGQPSAEMAAARRLFSRPAKTMTAASRVSRSVTRRPPTNLLSMAMRLSVAVKNLPPPCTTRISLPSCASAATCRARARTVASSSSKVPANLMTILIEVRSAPRYPACDLSFERPGRQRLSRDCRDRRPAPDGVRKNPVQTDVAEIGMRHMLQLRQRACGPDAHHRAPRIEAPEQCFDVRSSLRRIERDVDRRKNSPRDRQQMSGKHDLRFAQTGVLEDFRSVPVREEAISLEILVHFDKVQIATRILARAACSGLAVANDRGVRGDPAGFGERPKR